MNILGAVAVAFSIWVFALTYRHLRHRSAIARLACFSALAPLAIPSVLFATYYLHLLPDREWFYTLRSWRGTEFLVVFLGGFAGAAASLLPRWLRLAPLISLMVTGAVPYIKPLIGPLPDHAFQERWQGDICLQSTEATCGPASVSTILAQLGARTSEKDVARAAFSSASGTEAWYLARFARSKGFVPRFYFKRPFSPAAGLPALVGVRVGGLGHFIAVLDLSSDHVTFADPLLGEERLSLSEFQRRYHFTGFHMVITKS
jgi:Peptidase C39 family